MFSRPVVMAVQAWLPPGTVVSVPVLGVFSHNAIVSDRSHGGKPMVIASSARAGGVVEEPWDMFAQGCVVSSLGYPGRLPWPVVVRRARSVIGKRYDLFRANCDHLVTYAHGFKPQSPQLAAALGIVAFGVGIGLASARR